jgi:hypothetical protein
VPFAVDRLQHLYRDPLQVVKSLAGSCEHDVACHPEYQQLSEAIAGLGTIGVDALFCTGTLVNTQVNDHTPLFLTANHCHVQDFPAATEVYWNYQTASCGGEAPSIFDVKRSSHLTLVSTNTYSDFTLLMIDGSLPSSELYWAGWTSASVPTGVTAVAIHHPRGDVKKISFANVDRELDCASFFPGRSVVPVGWTDGVTEPGSSGSGIFRTDTNQLFGQLFGGPSACGEVPENLYDCYGAFATTYQRISKPLKNGTDDKLEPNDGCKQARVLHNGKAKGLVLRAGDQDWYRVQVPAHKSASFKLAFTNAYGDLDIAAYDTCPGKSPLAVAATSADGENLLVKNSGTKPAWIYVNVYFGDEDTRANYDLTVSQK